MRLLRLEDGGDFSLVEFVGRNIPRYAVLSHTWDADHEEVTFKDLMNGTGNTKAGYRKIRFCTTQAACDGLQFSWVDTCCIDKSSSAELSEAINSMFRWYHDAAKCYLYLPDVSVGDFFVDDLSSQWAWKSAFQLSRWFTRGWTLQELIAPASVEFFSLEGERLGDKDSMVQEIHEITGISVRALQGSPLSEFSINERMSWAATRETKREEDAAYSLLGVFDVHIPLIYGEGRKKAFIRLQREMKESLKDESPSDRDRPEYQPLQKTEKDKDAGLASTKISNAEKPKGLSNTETSTAVVSAATLRFTAARKLREEQREQRPSSAQSIRSTSGINRLFTPDLYRPKSVNSNRSGTPPLRPSDRKVAALTQRSKPDLAKEAELAVITASLVNTANPSTNKGRVQGKDIADVYDGVGEGRMGSPWSPTRPNSTRRRQSMQVHELENRVERLAADDNMLETKYAQATRELQEVRDAYTNLTSDMEGIVRSKVQKLVLEKDQEIIQLWTELDAAKKEIRDRPRQISANEIDFLTVKDEDYFDNACQQLYQHVQQWVLRPCRLTGDISNEKTINRLDNAILDGSDVDIYLSENFKRRDIFMSITMTMVWEIVFTRYLFGMDREQRQKLKSLEKTLSEAGSAAAVHLWRATTLTLLSKRSAFQQQREEDTQGVVQAILETLSEISEPPSHLEVQIKEQLARVIRLAVDLSIEMRCQRAEYMMLPPLQPEYNANGDLASKVSFNATLIVA